MGKKLAKFFFAVLITVSVTNTSALTDAYFAAGEDLDFLVEADNSLALKEIEYKLRRFVIFRKIEDYIFDLTDTYLED